MSKRLKPSGTADWRMQANREEELKKYAGLVHACVKKAEKTGRVMMRKVATSRKSKTQNRSVKNKTNFSL